MHNLKTLKEMLVKELDNYGKSGTLSKASLDTIDKLAHATKNVIKVIDSCSEEEDYSFSRGYSREHSYRDGGYSNSDNLKNQLYDIMDSVSDERTRNELRRLASRI